MVFKLYDTDYSDKIMMDTYDVNEIDVFTSWEDANGTIHRSSYRKQVKGQFDMMFSNLVEYQAFIMKAHANRSQNHGGAIFCEVAVNNLDAVHPAYYYVDFETIRTMNNNYTKGYLNFTVTIEER